MITLSLLRDPVYTYAAAIQWKFLIGQVVFVCCLFAFVGFVSSVSSSVCFQVTFGIEVVR
jgi:hypothetical protein